MATEARIAIANQDGSYDFALVYFEGFPSHMIPFFQRYLTSEEKVREVVKVGNIVMLDDRSGKLKFDPVDYVTYDLGNQNPEELIFRNFEDLSEGKDSSGCYYGNPQHTYIFQHGRWYGHYWSSQLKKAIPIVKYINWLSKLPVNDRPRF